MENMDVDDDKETQLSETKRVSRNMNEKRRRDRFNVLIGELSAVIPQSTGSGKFDKTTILKKAIAFLRNYQDVSSSSMVVSRPTTNWQPAFVSDSELNHLLLETMDSFLLIIDGSGIITFASDSILSILGYRPQDVLNNSIADYLDQSDQSCIFAHLAFMLEQLKTPNPQHSKSNSSSIPVSKVLNFEMTMNSGPCFEKQMVDSFSCTGQTFVTYPRVTTRTAHNERTDDPKLQLVLVCSLNGPMVNPVVPLSNVTSKEFTSRLTLDWKFTYIDSRVIDIIGYQPHEMLKKSIYSFIHKEDLVNVGTYHKMLVRKGYVTTCYYRFLTKGETWIWLRSCCYISYNQWNSKPEYVTLTTKPINYEEVYANQEQVVQSDKLQFQNIAKVFNSSQALESAKQRGDYSISMLQAQTSKDDNNSSVYELAVSQRGSKDDSGEMELNSSQSESSSTSKSMFSCLEAPEGLNPAQYKLHKQLQGKHILLEKSIERQMADLQKIKRQIEINKQLWEFNRQLQEKKAEKMSQTAASSNSCTASDKSSDIASTYVPQDSNLVPLNGSASNYSLEIPASLYLSVPEIDPVVGQTNYASLSEQTLNETSQAFTPLQPYQYYQY